MCGAVQGSSLLWSFSSSTLHEINPLGPRCASYPVCALTVQVHVGFKCCCVCEFHGQRAGSDNWDDRPTLSSAWIEKKPEESVCAVPLVLLSGRGEVHLPDAFPASPFQSVIGWIWKKWIITKQLRCTLLQGRNCILSSCRINVNWICLFNPYWVPSHSCVCAIFVRAFHCLKWLKVVSTTNP